MAIAHRNNQPSQDIYKQLEAHLLEVGEIRTDSGNQLINTTGDLNVTAAYEDIEKSSELLNCFLQDFGTNIKIDTGFTVNSLIKNLQEGSLVIIGCNILGSNDNDDSHAILIKHAVANFYSVYDSNSNGVQAIRNEDLYKGILRLNDSGYAVKLFQFCLTI